MILIFTGLPFVFGGSSLSVPDMSGHSGDIGFFLSFFVKKTAAAAHTSCIPLFFQAVSLKMKGGVDFAAIMMMILEMYSQMRRTITPPMLP